MAILSSFVTLEGKFAVQVAAHQKQGLCLYMSHLHRCKWFKRLPSTMRPAAIDGGALLNAALENKYASLAETTRDRLLNALYPGRKKELKMSEAKVRISNNATIATITEGVKKRAAAAERFALYQVGMTVTEYVAAGGKRGEDDGEAHRAIFLANDRLYGFGILIPPAPMIHLGTR